MKNKNKRNQAIPKKYSDTSITVLELATNYGMSAAEVITILSAQLGDRYRELVELKRQNYQGANTMSKNKLFYVGDKVQWTNAEGDRVIGVISKMFKSKCWLEPAGSDRVGETITGVFLEEIELYSSEPGPIEVALNQMQSDNCQSQQLSESVEPVELEEDNCQTQQLSQWKVGDSVAFFEGEEYVTGTITEIDEEKNTCWVENESEFHPEVPLSQLLDDRAEETEQSEEELPPLESDNCQDRQLSQWQPGDRIQFFDEDSDQWISGEIDSIEDGRCTISTSAGETWFILASQLEPAEEDSDNNSQTQQLSESLEPVESVELDELDQWEQDNKCQDRHLSHWKPGDRVKFLDSDSQNWVSGTIDSVEDEECVLQSTDGETWYVLVDILEAEESEETSNSQDRQLSESVESVELDELDEEDNCQDRQFEEIPESDGDSETFWLPLDAIAEHPDFQPRGRNWQTQDKGINSDVVSQYTDWLEFSEPPALEVWFGELEGEEKYWLLAGHHRIRALRKAGRENVQCFQWAQSYEEAIYRASTSNAGRGNRTRQIHKMEDFEWREACKQFLRICDRLSPEAIHEFLNEAAMLTGQSKKWPKLNNMAIAAVFGISPASVIEYKKQIQMERLAEKFPMGTRVLLVNYSEIFLLEKREHRLGVVDVFNPTKGVMVKFDSCRAKDGYFHPNDLKVVDDPLPEQHSFKIGDKVWKDQPGVVVAISPDENSKPNLWSVYLDITELTPLVCWDNGYHQVVEKMDYDGPGQPLSIEQRLVNLSQYLESIKDDSSQNWKICNAKEQIKYLQSLINPSENQSESTTIKEQEKDQRKELLGRSTPAGGGGSNGAELPDVSTTNGKHPENPETTAVGPLERPAEVKSLEDAKFYARQSAARNALANVKLDLEVLPDDDLKDILKAAKAELTRRHRPEQEGDPQRRLELEIA